VDPKKKAASRKGGSLELGGRVKLSAESARRQRFFRRSAYSLSMYFFLNINLYSYLTIPLTRNGHSNLVKASFQTRASSRSA
jgi:hypothetical protein